MDSDDDEDSVWLFRALCKMREASNCARPDPVPRLLGHPKDSPRFFEATYASSNAYLFRDHFRMDKEAFDKLFDDCDCYISAKIKYRKEVVAVTLDWLGRASSCRDQEVKFRLAFSTVHRYRRVGLYAILHALSSGIKFPNSVPAAFARKFPYFDQAVAAIDGVHVPVMVAASDAERFRNRKGWTSTNVLIASDWEMNVAFIYPGAEGAAHDSMVLGHSHLLEEIEQHHYAIADAGYALSSQVLTPYRGVRYHLNEWAEDSGRPKTAKELFNLRHTKARNVVERLNGCMKRRFKILRVAIETEFVVAKAIVFACACLHNFIRCQNASDLAKDLGDDEDSSDGEDETWTSATEVFPFDFTTASNWRDWMAGAMWDEYTQF